MCVRVCARARVCGCVCVYVCVCVCFSVVAVEVKPNVENGKIIEAVQHAYARLNKYEILIFAMAKPYPGNRVEVLM